MTTLCAVAMVVAAISGAFLAGMEVQKWKAYEPRFVPPPVPCPVPPPQMIFVQRLPGQEPGDVEELPNNVIYVKGWIQ